MQEINLNQIKPSPNPVRKTWDEGKMEELAQSIREQGVIVPIKVRPNGNGYEVVYGHRRVEASKRAGLNEIPAIVETPDDTDALIQALVENLQREDMTLKDEYHSYIRLRHETNWTPAEIVRRGIMTRGRVHRLESLTKESEDVKQMLHLYDDSRTVNGNTNTITETHVEAVRGAIRNKEDRAPILRKANSEDLTYKDTRAVADAYVKAETPELKQTILDTPIKDEFTGVKLSSSDAILRRARAELGHDATDEFDKAEQSQKRKDRLEIKDDAVKAFLDTVKTYYSVIDGAIADVDYGRYSPEAAQYTIRRLERLQEKISEMIMVLGDIQ